MSNQTVQLKQDGRIAQLSFYNPAGNAMSSAMLQQLTQYFNDLNERQDVSVIALKSEGSGAFCAGANFKELLQITNAEEGKAFFSGFAKLLCAMKNCSKPIVTKVQGKAVGGGVGVIAASDVVIASNTAEVKLSEIQIGIAPLVIAPVIIHKIGVAHFSKLSFDPSTFHTSHWALDKGLFSAVAQDETELNTLFNQKVHFLSELNPEALHALKNTIWKGTEHFDQEMLHRAAESGKLVLSEQTTLALAPYRNKS